jgi:hypothetical protein
MKKTLSIILSLAIVLSSIGAGTAVFAADTKTAKVSYSVYDGAFLMEPTELEVSADLSDKYKDEIGFNDSSAEPTILDATIAAHLEYFKYSSKSFTKLNAFKLSSAGWITTAFGNETMAVSYRVDGKPANALTETVSDGKYIEFAFYQDTLAYSDSYSYFEKRSVEALENQEITLTLSKEGFDESYNTVISPAANADITINGKPAGKTDANGKITLTFAKAGTYNISAKNNIAGTPIFAPWCVITVAENKLANYLDKEISGAAKYALNGVTSLDVNSAIDYLTYLKSGYDMSSYNKAFLASVKENLDKNGGKLKVTYNGAETETIGAYGAVIQILDILGMDATNFEGYNIVSAFESIDMNAAYHPYYYRVAIEAASEEFAKKLCDKLIKEHYTLGKGLALPVYGYACDNTAYFLTAIAKYKDSYTQYVDDAKAVIKTYTKDGGAFADFTYVTSVNPDSTALAMMAYASIGDVKGAFDYYKTLVSSFESTTAGVFLYDGKENLLATKDALLGLEYFVTEVKKQGFEHPEEVYKTTITKATPSKNGKIVNTCPICEKSIQTTIYYPKTVNVSSKYAYTGKAITPKITVTDGNNQTIANTNYTVKYSNNKNIGTATVTVTFSGNYSGTIKQTFKIVPKATKITKYSSKKNSITVKWSKITTKTKGYQIQYSTDKNFKKNVKKITLTNNKTTSRKLTNLKANKKYYVRIRTYTTVKKTNYCSKWSAVTTVKTKK